MIGPGKLGGGGRYGSIRIRDLRVGYRRDSETHMALHGITLALPTRQLSVIAGPGGSGKSSLLRALSPEPKPAGFWSSGEIELPSQAVATLQQRRAGDRADEADDGERPVRGSASTDGVLSAWRAGSAVAERLSRGAADLPRPSWWDRLMSLTRVIARPADCYLLDEPDVDLPPDLVAPVVGRLRRLSCDASVLVVTHNVAIARRLADFAVLIVDGRVIEAASAEDFFTRPAHPRTREFLRMGS